MCEGMSDETVKDNCPYKAFIPENQSASDRISCCQVKAGGSKFPATSASKIISSLDKVFMGC